MGSDTVFTTVRSIFEAEVSLSSVHSLRTRRSATKIDNFVYLYMISFSNDGIHFGNNITYWVYNSSYQTITFQGGANKYQLKVYI